MQLNVHRSLKYQVKRYLGALKYLTMIYTGYIPASRLRFWIYGGFGLQLGEGSHIYSGAELRQPDKISIGTGTSIGHGAILDGRGGLTIGHNVNFSTGVWIWTTEHLIASPDFEVEYKPVTIEDYAWLSCRTIIMPGVTVGKGAVVAAGAVVTRDVGPYTIVAGVPAQKIGERTKDLRYQLTNHIPMI